MYKCLDVEAERGRYRSYVLSVDPLHDRRLPCVIQSSTDALSVVNDR